MLDEPLQIYEKLWHEAMAAFEQGGPQIDPHLSDQSKDLRRGVTIALRLPPTVRDEIRKFLNQLAAICPEQYFYHPEELHVTVLAIISGTESWQKEIRQMDVYRDLIGNVLRRQHSFSLRFQGVTASPGSVMIQGFSTDGGLAKIRADLREAFTRAGFAGQLDRRYKINTAHVTAMRFRQPGADWKRLAARLQKSREIDFGEMEVRCLQLMLGDWYASVESVQILEEYRLMSRPGNPSKCK